MAKSCIRMQPFKRSRSSGSVTRVDSKVLVSLDSVFFLVWELHFLQCPTKSWQKHWALANYQKMTSPLNPVGTEHNSALEVFSHHTLGIQKKWVLIYGILPFSVLQSGYIFYVYPPLTRVSDIMHLTVPGISIPGTWQDNHNNVYALHTCIFSTFLHPLTTFPSLTLKKNSAKINLKHFSLCGPTFPAGHYSSTEGKKNLLISIC